MQPEKESNPSESVRIRAHSSNTLVAKKACAREIAKTFNEIVFEKKLSMPNLNLKGVAIRIG